jgi:ketosteroid isomerase-like protein
MDIPSTLKELCEAFNAHDLDRIMTFFADDCVLEMPRGNDPWVLVSRANRKYAKR